jgi:hypothetical protein
MGHPAVLGIAGYRVTKPGEFGIGWRALCAALVDVLYGFSFRFDRGNVGLRFLTPPLDIPAHKADEPRHR